jgi:butyryl-CoA dehydrogenase
MFQMMNGARIDVGLTAVSIASAAYHASLQYAKERPQGRRITTGKKDANAPQTTIINHPDVRRMLHLQEAVVGGSVALLMTASTYKDKAEHGPEEDRQKYHELLELLTPIAKTYPSEMGRVSINNGLQVLGGYGFCTDFPLEQLYRDVRITALYEGTTGIQSQDLLGRKVVMNNGAAMQHLTKEIISTIKQASNFDDLKPYAEQLKSASKELANTTQHLLTFAMKGDHERYIADATIYMEMMSNIVIAWQWLEMATVAKTALVNGKTVQSTSFYERQIHTMRFYFKYELPKIAACKHTLHSEDNLTIPEANEVAFS